MFETIQVSKVDTWARIPVESSTEMREFIVHNAYQSKLPSKQAKELSTGLILPVLENKTVLLMGQPAKHSNKGIEIRKKFCGSNDELTTIAVNTTEEDISVNPYSFPMSIVVLRVAGGCPKVVDNLDETQRGDKGFGSTGKN